MDIPCGNTQIPTWNSLQLYAMVMKQLQTKLHRTYEYYAKFLLVEKFLAAEMCPEFIIGGYTTYQQCLDVVRQHLRILHLARQNQTQFRPC